MTAEDTFIQNTRLARPVRIALLVHDHFGLWSSKTATSLLRYGQEHRAVVLIDRSRAGQDASIVVGPAGRGVPIVASVAEARAYAPEALVIGIAPVGGHLPDAWRPDILAALEAGMDIMGGLHDYLSEDPELADAAAAAGRRIWDIRKPAEPHRVATGAGLDVTAMIVHTMGTDCNSGKMTTAVEMTREARRRGVDAAFIATGQTGLLLGPDAGAPIDAIAADFVAGTAEQMVLDCAQQGKALIIVEGQGALTHPAYSGVTLGLMHGCFPDMIVLCHVAGRRFKGEYGTDKPTSKTLPLAQEIDLIEQLLAPVTGGRVVAVSLATPHLDAEAANAAVAAAQAQTGLPATDPVRFGPGVLVDAVMAAWATHHRKGVNFPRISTPSKPNSA